MVMCVQGSGCTCACRFLSGGVGALNRVQGKLGLSAEASYVDDGLLDSCFRRNDRGRHRRRRKVVVFYMQGFGPIRSSRLYLEVAKVLSQVFVNMDPGEMSSRLRGNDSTVMCMQGRADACASVLCLGCWGPE